MASIDAQVATLTVKIDDHLAESRTKYAIFEETTKNVDEIIIHLKWIKAIGYTIIGLSTPNLIEIIKFFTKTQ